MKNGTLVNMIIEYESGELSDKKTLDLFAELIKTGQAWTLQGHYSRTATALIEDGFITSAGKLTEKSLSFMKI